MKGGTTSEALEDFTGGITEFFDLSNPPSHLMEMMMRGMEMGSLMGCSIEVETSVTVGVFAHMLVAIVFFSYRRSLIVIHAKLSNISRGEFLAYCRRKGSLLLSISTFFLECNSSENKFAQNSVSAYCLAG